MTTGLSFSNLLRYVLPVALLRRAARSRSSTGAYVSGIMRAPNTVRTAVKMAISAATHLHPPVSPRKPPICRERSSPIFGPALRTHNGTDRRAQKRRGSEDGHTQTPLPGVEEIGHGSTSVREG